MIRAPILAALTLFAAAPTLPQSAAREATAPAPRSYPAIERIDWTYGAESSGERSHNQLRFSHEGSTSSFGSDETTTPHFSRAASMLTTFSGSAYQA